MRVGIDSFTISELNLNPYEIIDYVTDNGFEGFQFDLIGQMSETLDHGELKKIKKYGDDKGIYTHVTITSVNPVLFEGGIDALELRLEKEIEAAAEAGWHELRCVINKESERYTHRVPWSVHIDGAIQLINRLRSVLERYGSRINLETHLESTYELLHVISCTGSHLTGICLDTANTLAAAEDPVLAAKRVAPYTHLTHAKDAIVCFSKEGKGIVRQGKPVGQGNVDFETILPILSEYSPDLPLSIEDHKWLWTADIFDEDWMKRNPDITPYELGQFVKIAWNTQERLWAGEIPPIDEYEATPFADEMEDRLFASRDYLFALLDKLNLH